MRKEGNSAIYTTTGNNACHVILRGGNQPNYDRTSIDAAVSELSASNLPANIMVDFSHANSEKKHKNQLQVGADVCRRIHDGEDRIFGVMIESHLKEGRQDVIPGKELTYGQSITDACLGWDDSEELIASLADASSARRSK